jgi:hypothetical protein
MRTITRSLLTAVAVAILAACAEPTATEPTPTVRANGDPPADRCPISQHWEWSPVVGSGGGWICVPDAAPMMGPMIGSGKR